MIATIASASNAVPAERTKHPKSRNITNTSAARKKKQKQQNMWTKPQQKVASGSSKDILKAPASATASDVPSKTSNSNRIKRMNLLGQDIAASNNGGGTTSFSRTIHSGGAVVDPLASLQTVGVESALRRLLSQADESDSDSEAAANETGVGGGAHELENINDDGDDDDGDEDDQEQVYNSRLLQMHLL